VAPRLRLDLPGPVARAPADPGNETPKPGDRIFDGAEYQLAARPADVFRAVESAVSKLPGTEFVLLGEALEGEARVVAAEHAALALEMRRQGRCAVIASGGELTVTVRGGGRGGPNQEYALALALALGGSPGIAALAADTDGTDGGAGAPDDPAGAVVDETTLQRARLLGLDPALFLANNDSSGLFARLGDLVSTGPTCTNVNDFRAIVVDRP
jgi:hydroxypyruvate reductase